MQRHVRNGVVRRHGPTSTGARKESPRLEVDIGDLAEVDVGRAAVEASHGRTVARKVLGKGPHFEARVFVHIAEVVANGATIITLHAFHGRLCHVGCNGWVGRVALLMTAEAASTGENGGCGETREMLRRVQAESESKKSQTTAEFTEGR